MTIIVAVVVLLAVTVMAGAVVMSVYIKQAHVLSEARDTRAHELALKETAAAHERIRVEASHPPARTSLDVSAARIQYHASQVELARKAIDTLTYRHNDMSDERKGSLQDAIVRQLGDLPPELAEHNEYWADGKKLL